MATLPAQTDVPCAEEGPQATDQSLLDRFVGEADDAAFRQLVERHAGMVLGVCLRRLGHRQDAEDAMQAVFLVLARGAGRIRRRGSLASWLYGVAHRIALKAGRQRCRLRLNTSAVSTAPFQVRRAPMLPVDSVPSGDEGPLESITRANELQVVEEELGQLPERYRTLLIQFYLAGRSVREIANETGLSLEAVDGRLKRGRRELRQRLVRRGVGLPIVLAIGHYLQPASVSAASSQALATTCLEAVRTPLAPESVSHQLAQTELLEMAMFAKKSLLFTAALLMAASVSFYGLASRLRGQESGGGAETVVLQPDASDEVSVVVTAASRQSPRRAGSESSLETTQPASTQTTSGQPSELILETLEQLGTSPPSAWQKVRAMEQKLASARVQLEFDQVPLGEAVDYLSASLEMPIIIDRQALEDIGVDPESPVTLRTAVPGDSALRLLLDQLQLDYVFRDDVLMITSQEAAQAQLDARVYRLTETTIPVEKLIEVITTVIAPDSWAEVGGSGSIVAVSDESGILAIAQTARVHSQIRDLLEQLR